MAWQFSLKNRCLIRFVALTAAFSPCRVRNPCSNAGFYAVFFLAGRRNRFVIGVTSSQSALPLEIQLNCIALIASMVVLQPMNGAAHSP